MEAGLQDRAFCARMSDGGKMFEFLSRMTHNIEVRSVMPSTVQLSENELLSDMWRRHDVRRSGLADVGKNWVDVYHSDDDGKTKKIRSSI